MARSAVTCWAVGAAFLVCGCGDGHSPVVVSGEALVVARSEGDKGNGWRADVGMEAGACTGGIILLGVSEVRVDGTDVTGLTFKLAGTFPYGAGEGGPTGWTGEFGWSGHWDGKGTWGTGPLAGAGLYVLLGDHVRLRAYVAAYGWLGSRDDRALLGVEASAAVCIDVRSGYW